MAGKPSPIPEESTVALAIRLQAIYGGGKEIKTGRGDKKTL